MEVTACRARFRAAGRLAFPEQASNALRGALGFALDAGVFRPVRTGGPSGLRNPPRPFVLHASHLDGAVVEAGGSFELELSLFYVDPELFRVALGRLHGWSLGPVQLEGFEAKQIQLDLQPVAEAPSALRVSFLTPTELKGHDCDGPPEFRTLMARLRDRVGALRAFYGPGPLALDFRSFLKEAETARLHDGRVEWVAGSRRSARTGQRHPLGGFKGFADYEGDFGRYLPFLEAGLFTCAGRQTVWGHGRIGIRPIS